MAKRRLKGRIAESSATFKFRKRQQKLRNKGAKAKTRVLPKKTKPMTLMEKGDQIGLLAIRHQKKFRGAKNFLEFLLIRRRPGMTAIKKNSLPHEKKAEAVIMGFIDAGMPVTKKVLEINQWLESIGRKDLKVTMGDIIEMILS